MSGKISKAAENGGGAQAQTAPPVDGKDAAQGNGEAKEAQQQQPKEAAAAAAAAADASASRTVLEDPPDLVINVVVLTGMVMTIEVNVTEMALDVKQILGESLESCFMTNYALHRPDGTPMHDYDTFEDCRQGDVFTMRFKKYDDKDMRYHVAHTQELVMVSLDHVMVSAVYTEPHHTPSPADQRSYPSLQKIMGSEV